MPRLYIDAVVTITASDAAYADCLVFDIFSPTPLFSCVLIRHIADFHTYAVIMPLLIRCFAAISMLSDMLTLMLMMSPAAMLILRRSFADACRRFMLLYYLPICLRRYDMLSIVCHYEYYAVYRYAFFFFHIFLFFLQLYLYAPRHFHFCRLSRRYLPRPRSLRRHDDAADFRHATLSSLLSPLRHYHTLLLIRHCH